MFDGVAVGSQTTVRELRWSYVRGAERRSCRISLDERHRSYEFRVHDERPGSWVKHERYVYACEAIERHCEYERQLLDAGFSLEDFEQVRDIIDRRELAHASCIM